MKNMGKINIIMVAVVALGIFALPSVMSVGTGQHTFNNGSAVDCNKCHANSGDKVAAELAASGTTMYPTLGSAIGDKIHALDNTGVVGSCKDCHRLTANPEFGHTGVTLKPVCVDCHINVASEINNTADPHTRFGDQGNAGCLGCHTAVSIGGSPSYSYSGSVTSLGLTIGDGTGP